MIEVKEAGPLTVEDVEVIIEGIEEFCMTGDPVVNAIWQPYVDKLTQLKAILKGR